jgi:hypothetical protein
LAASGQTVDEPDVTEVASRRRITFPLRALFTWLLLLSVAFGVLRFLAFYPGLIAPAVLCSLVIAMILTPNFAVRYDTPAKRLAVGCVVLPVAYLVIAFLFTGLIFLLRRLIVD